MKNPARNLLSRSVEKSVERIPEGLSYVNNESEEVSGYKNNRRTAVERNELTNFGHCLTDIQIICVDDSKKVEYLHVIEGVEVHSFNANIDDLSLVQLGRVAMNLHALSTKLEEQLTVRQR